MNFKKYIGRQPLGFQMAPMADIMFILLIHLWCLPFCNEQASIQVLQRIPGFTKRQLR